jgi:hypothetical protein
MQQQTGSNVKIINRLRDENNKYSGVALTNQKCDSKKRGTAETTEKELTMEQSMSSISMNKNKTSIFLTMATTTCCELCCEATSALVVLSSTCSHPACRECLTKWITKQESLNKETVPCPYCRVTLNDRDIFQILGRPMQLTCTRRVTVEKQTTTELDDLTHDWLQANTRQCPNCHLHIEKLDGCDKMECVCGCRFCFKCGTANATCRCTPRNHVFWDNIRYCNSGRTAETVVVVNLDTDTVGTMIGQRIRLEDNRLKSQTRNRMRRFRRIEIGAIDRAPMYAVSICNGSWLFRPKDSIKTEDETPGTPFSTP